MPSSRLMRVAPIEAECKHAVDPGGVFHGVSGTSAELDQTIYTGSGWSTQSVLHDFDAVVQDADIPQFRDPEVPRDGKFTITVRNNELVMLVERLTRTLSFASRSCCFTGSSRKGCGEGRSHWREQLHWVDLDGLAIIIRDKAELVNELLPIAFPKAKFSSFKRKLYHWGFWQVKGKASVLFCKEEAKMFWHKDFRRDDIPLMASMISNTAEGMRRV